MNDVKQADHVFVHVGEARVACPTCGAPVAWTGSPQRPFCSRPCRLIDLGLWLDGRYRIDGDDDRSGAPSDPR